MINDYSGNKTTPKRKAQLAILVNMGSAFADISDDIDMTDKEKEIVFEQMSKQMARMEKIFGYEPNSFMRGF